MTASTGCRSPAPGAPAGPGRPTGTNPYTGRDPDRDPARQRRRLRRGARVTEDREDEIVDWHIEESGEAASAAAFEHAITLRDFYEASSLSNRSAAPALATGNAVVLKSAGDTPVTGGLMLAKVYEEAGLPEGLLSVVIGSGRDIGDAIVSHPTPRVASFTGSTPVGKGIAEKAGPKKLSLELGGNGPLVVLADADVGHAVDDAVHDELVERYVERVRGLEAGDPAEEDTVIGPIINARQLEGIQETVAQSIADGARQVLGATRPARSGRCGPRTCCSATTTSQPPARRCSGRWPRSSGPRTRPTR